MAANWLICTSSDAYIATEKGLQLGIQQGLQEGLQQGKIQTARQFKILGVALETIAEATGLTMEQVEAL